MTANVLVREKRLTVRFRPHEWEALVAAAAVARQRVAEFAREALNATVRSVPVDDMTEERMDQ